jgi:hypothetical protein
LELYREPDTTVALGKLAQVQMVAPEGPGALAPTSGAVQAKA